MENVLQLEYVWPSCTCAAVFLVLILWDVWRAWKRRAHWVPGRALVLSALTIQMLALIDFSDISYISSKHEKYQKVAVLVTEDQLLFDCTRLVMCVFIAYLLPSMVRAKWTQVWSEMGALILSVMLRMAFEVYFVWKVNSPLCSTSNAHQSIWFIVSSTAVATASLSLLLLLSCAVLAGKSIRYILSLKIRWLLSCCSNPHSCSFEKCEKTMCKNSCCSYISHRQCKNWCCSDNLERCKSTEDHVLKCWIVARVSQPEYIMARSVFISLAGMIVTMAVVIVIGKWAYLHLPQNPGILLRTTICIESAFIIVGWTVVSFRWLTAVLYFPRKMKFLLYLEDFWTMHVAELKADWDVNLRRKKLAKESHCKGLKEKKSSGEGPIRTVIINSITALRLQSVLLPMRAWLQKLMVWLSKACWGFSQKLMGMFRPFLINTQKRLLRCSSPEATQYCKYLEFIRMPGEIAQNLWIANKTAFEKTQRKMEEGITDGKGDRANLIQLIKQKTELKDEDKNYFNEMSWKRKAISWMCCMVHFYEDTSNFDAINGCITDNLITSDIQEEVVAAYKKGSIINDAMEACSDAWDLLDFVDSSENGRADTEFDELRNMWHKHFGNLKRLKGAMDQLQMEEKTTCALKDWRGSEDWMGLTVHCSSYCKLYMKFHSLEEWQRERDVHYLVSILAYFIRDRFDKELKDVLIEKCTKWAEEGNDEEIYRAAFIAGKAKGLRDKFAEHEGTEKQKGQPDNIGEGDAKKKMFQYRRC